MPYYANLVNLSSLFFHKHWEWFLMTADCWRLSTSEWPFSVGTNDFRYRVDRNTRRSTLFHLYCFCHPNKQRETDSYRTGRLEARVSNRVQRCHPYRRSLVSHHSLPLEVNTINAKPRLERTTALRFGSGIQVSGISCAMRETVELKVMKIKKIVKKRFIRFFGHKPSFLWHK